jgi:hypothetical protein
MRPPHRDDVHKSDALNDELDKLRQQIDVARNAGDRRSMPERRAAPRATPDRRRTER